MSSMDSLFESESESKISYLYDNYIHKGDFVLTLHTDIFIGYRLWHQFNDLVKCSLSSSFTLDTILASDPF